MQQATGEMKRHQVSPPSCRRSEWRERIYILLLEMHLGEKYLADLIHECSSAMLI